MRGSWPYARTALADACHSYQFKPPYPYALGGEVAGVVSAVGAGVKGVAAGDRVVAMLGWGGLQEKVVVGAAKALKIPAGLDFVSAAALTMTYGTTIHALADRGELKKGETLLVLGAAGGVGVAAIEIGKAMGARVIAACSTPEKAALCREFGADEVVIYSKENLKQRVSELTNGEGADVVYDAVGGEHAEPALRSTAWRGRYLVIGFVGGIPKIPLNLTLLKGCDVRGVFWGAFTSREPEKFARDLDQLATWIRQDKIHPGKAVTETWPLEKAAEAVGRLESRQVRGKAVVVLEPSKL